jgi:hypothetical protein
MAADRLIGDHRPRMAGAEGRDRAPFVAGGLERLVLVGKRDPSDPEVRAQLRPIDPAPAGHKHEDVVVGTSPDDDRAEQLPDGDALEAGALLGASRTLRAHHLERDACIASGEDARRVGGVAHAAPLTVISASTSTPARSVSSTTQ